MGAEMGLWDPDADYRPLRRGATEREKGGWTDPNSGPAVQLIWDIAHQDTCDAPCLLACFCRP